MNSNNHLVIRADASPAVGVGHVMRSLALAQAWQDAGGSVTFASAGLPEVLKTRIQTEGMSVHTITSPAGTLDDVAELTDLIQRFHSAAVVIDGYIFDEQYLTAISSESYASLIVDDNAHLSFYATDFVLNQNAGVTKSIYQNRLENAELLLGTSYALLRREFLDSRPAAKSKGKGNRILVTLGGSDPDNITERIIAGLSSSQTMDLQVRVIVGALNEHLRRIQEVVNADKRFQILQNLGDMAEQYRWADIAIAAGGSSNWEMCYFGLPRILLVIADNQVSIADELERKKIAINLGNAANVTPHGVADAVDRLLSNSGQRLVAEQKANQLVDGKGPARCVERLRSHSKSQAAGLIMVHNEPACSSTDQLVLRDATIDDWQLLLQWRNDPGTRRASRNTDLVDETSHRKWLRNFLKTDNCKLLIAEVDSIPIGTVRLDLEEVCEVSWTVAPEARGKGFGKRMVSEAVQTVTLPMKSVARVENIGSQKIAEAAGFHMVEDDGEWQTFHRGTGTVN